MATFKITVWNRTGGAQDYSFFSSPPAVSGGQGGGVWSNVFKSARRIPNDGSASMQVTLDYFAICGSYDNSPESGGQATLSRAVPIILGSDSNGESTMGSSITLDVVEQSTFNFSDPTYPGSGKIDSFELVTKGDFTLSDAKNNNLFVGVGCASDSELINTLSTFTPSPNSSYQIQPQNVYHVVAGGNLRRDSAVKAEQFTSSVSVDFNARRTDDVNLIHSEEMEFVFT